VDREPETSTRSAAAQLAAIVAWGAPSGPTSPLWLRSITQPTLVVNGKSDLVVPTINSYTLFSALPHARLHLYQDSGHGALFQYAEEFVREGLTFLDD
jgi:pimeloyl-ACP methyl ester carboxylesterase